MKNLIKRIALVTMIAISFVAAPAFAQVDTTAVETELANLPIYMGAIGSGLTLGAVAAVAWKWIKGALFG